MATPLTHDTPGETAQPGGTVPDWREAGRPRPGHNLPAFALVERDYTAVAAKLAGLGPLAEESGMTVKGVTVYPRAEARWLADRCGTAAGGAASGRPLLDTDVKFCEAILALSGTTNGRLAAEGFARLAERCGPGSGLTALGESVAERRVVFSDTQARPVQVGASFEWSGKEGPERRYAPFTINTEHRKPWHTLTGRQHFYLDHDWMAELGEQLPVYRPPLDLASLGEHPPTAGVEGARSVTVRYVTPHSKWSIHSEYQENLLMQTLARGGPVIWLSVQTGTPGERAQIPGHRPARRSAQRPHQTPDQAHPPHRRLRPAVLRPQLLRPHRQPARRRHHHPTPLAERGVLTCLAAHPPPAASWPRWPWS